MRGCLGLGPIGSASVGESPPPGLNDELQKARVMRIFPLTDAMLAGPQVLGDKLARLLLCDLYQWNDHLSGSPSKLGLPVLLDGWWTAGWSSSSAGKLWGGRCLIIPIPFGCALDMVTAMSYDPPPPQFGACQVQVFSPH